MNRYIFTIVCGFTDVAVLLLFLPEVENQQQPSMKQRHYDTDQIRKYMQRQKAERLKRQKEMELRLKEEEESKRRQLNDLRAKQRQVSAQSAAVGRKSGRQQSEPPPGQDPSSNWANKYPHVVNIDETLSLLYIWRDILWLRGERWNNS